MKVVMVENPDHFVGVAHRREIVVKAQFLQRKKP